MPAPQLIASAEVSGALSALAAAIAARHPAPQPLILAGIQRGGVPFARLLAAALRQAREGFVTVAAVDVSFHRDDIGRNPIPRELPPSEFPTDVTDATVILCDDVLFSGRTVKAALDELFDHGRPARVELAVLVDRGGRRLPVAADYRGFTLDVPPGGRVRVVLDEGPAAAHRVEIDAG